MNLIELFLSHTQGNDTSKQEDKAYLQKLEEERQKRLEEKRNTPHYQWGTGSKYYRI